MYKFINIDAAVEHVKNIVDSNRCVVCDKKHGTCMRYACGHTSCEDCILVATDCSVCLTPSSAPRRTVADKPKTRRIENAINLLNVFQNEFHIDVYKRQRLSEQLKVEKELFPKCIQAPIKYFNKRKSYINTKHNKENKLSQLPGEEISFSWDHKMDQSGGNVEKWLKKYVRKPFADLDKNDERLRNPVVKRQKFFEGSENTPTEDSSRKRSYLKTSLSVVKKQSHANKHLTPVRKKEYHKKPRIEKILNIKSDKSKYFKTGTNIKANCKDESDVVMDDEAIVVIEDSQSIKTDKDVMACLAVLEAENNKQYDLASMISSKSDNILIQDIENVEGQTEAITKVPFYLKSHLSKTCFDCNKVENDDTEHYKKEPTSNDVSITVESKSFTAIVNVKRIENIKNDISMQSVEVQTDESESIVNNSMTCIFDLDSNNLVNQIRSDCQSPIQDLPHDENILEDNMNNIVRRGNLKSENVIIEESDSDGDVEASVLLEVMADIHRSCEDIDYGILSDVKNLAEHSKRPRRAARGFTPTSTDSSDKENYNPNRKKKAISSKKKPMKK